MRTIKVHMQHPKKDHISLFLHALGKHSQGVDAELYISHVTLHNAKTKESMTLETLDNLKEDIQEALCKRAYCHLINSTYLGWEVRFHASFEYGTCEIEHGSRGIINDVTHHGLEVKVYGMRDPVKLNHTTLNENSDNQDESWIPVADRIVQDETIITLHRPPHFKRVNVTERYGTWS